MIPQEIPRRLWEESKWVAWYGLEHLGGVNTDNAKLGHEQRKENFASTWLSQTFREMLIGMNSKSNPWMFAALGDIAVSFFLFSANSPSSKVKREVLAKEGTTLKATMTLGETHEVPSSLLPSHTFFSLIPSTVIGHEIRGRSFPFKQTTL